MNQIRIKILLPAILVFLFSTFGHSQSIQFGITGGITTFYKPEFFTKNISKHGLGLKWGSQIGIKAKYTFSTLPLKLTGIFSYVKSKRKGTTNIISPPWS